MGPFWWFSHFEIDTIRIIIAMNRVDVKYRFSL
jgi:hypothetical protein